MCGWFIEQTLSPLGRRTPCCPAFPFLFAGVSHDLGIEARPIMTTLSPATSPAPRVFTVPWSAAARLSGGIHGKGYGWFLVCALAFGGRIMRFSEPAQEVAATNDLT